MTISGFILRNALRNKRRLVLTILSVAVSLFLFTTLQAALRLLTNPPNSEFSALRVIVRHRVSLGNVLPEKYKHRIERMAGVRYCTTFTWFGGIYKDEANSNFPQFAVDAANVLKIFREVTVPLEQEQSFIEDRAGCLVGPKLMERFGWKIGDRITLSGTLWPVDLELNIRAVYHGENIDETNLFFHYDYFDELMGKKGIVGTFWIMADHADAVPRLIEQIDAAFRNTDAETKTETERAFQLEFISMLGNVKVFIGSISTVIVITMLLVSAGTMSMSIRERSREIAVLKALGFDSAQVFGLVLAESFGLAFAGGIIGCFGAKLLFEHIDVYRYSNGFLPFFPVPMSIIALGLLVAGAVGLFSSLMPAYTSIKKTVIDGLKTLD